MHVAQKAPPESTEQISPGMHRSLPAQRNALQGRVSSVHPDAMQLATIRWS
jgi:hypothetical protein